MKHILVSLFISVNMFFPAYALEKMQFHEIAIRNSEEGGPVCRVRVPRGAAKCKGNHCEMPAPRRSSLKIIHISLSCIPISALTGFENPPDDARVYRFKTANVVGNIMIIDELVPADTERMRELAFCLYGTGATFCGNAKTLVLKDGEAADGSRHVISFIKKISLTETTDE